MEKSGHDVNFVDDLPDYLTCVICQLALRNPVLLVNCGHRICNVCFEIMKEHATRTNTELLCPHDRMNVDVNKVVEDKGINRVVLDLKVKCKYYMDGCQWTGELRNVEAHSQRECRFMVQERMHTLLKQLQDRLNTCEMNLIENSKEIGTIKDQLHQKDEEITILKERCKNSEEWVVSLEKRIGQHSKQSIVKNAAAEPEVEWIVGPAKKYKAASEISNQQVQFDQLNEEIKLLKQNIVDIKYKQQAESLHMRVVKQLISNKSVVYKWKLENYTCCKNDNKKISSPKFYSGVQGHCCKLLIQWYGIHKGGIGIFFHLCDGIYNTEVSEPFTMIIKIEAVDKNGIKEEFTITPLQFKDMDLKIGAGYRDFLNMPKLSNFIIDDSFAITCTLIPV